jgi:competence protein ComEC
MDRPFVFITIPLVIGIILSYYFNFSIFTIFMLIVLGLGTYFVNLMRNSSNSIILFFIMAILGVSLGTYNLNSSILASRVDRDIILRGTVDDILWKEDGQGKYIVRINGIEDKSIHSKINEKLVLKVIGDKDIELGDEINFTGKLKKPLENTNPMLFNYRLNLLSNRIHTTMTIKDYSIIGINNMNKSFIYRTKANFRKTIGAIFDNNLNTENSSLMKSIVLGEYSYLEEENVEKYRNLGLAHILAVSGLHIGIIAGALIYILSHLGVNRKLNIIITLIIIWLYGYLIGFPPSLLRANIMFSIFFYAQTLAEPYDSINALFLAMFILLIINPMWIFNLGFQLSFIATFSIIYFTPKIQKVFYPYNNKIIYTLCGLLGVQIGLLPIQTYYFNRLSILSIFSNLVIAPILSLSLIIGTIMIGFYYSVPILIPLIGNLLDLILSIQFNLVNILYKFPFGIIKSYSPGIADIILYYILMLVIFEVIKIDKVGLSIKKVIIYYLSILLLFNSIILLIDKSIEIQFIDVGQGDSILINTKKGSYLVDTGGNIMDSFDVGKNITLPYLEKMGINRLKGVFITHFDDDHCKSLPLLIENIEINNILISYEDNTSKIYNEIKNKTIPLIILKENDLMWLDNNTSIKVLSPNEELIKRGFEGNNLSLVFLLSYYDRKILFTGDMEKEVELGLIDKFERQIDIIKVPHHGSNTSSTEELLSKIKPSVGIISVGRNNFYGHPRKEIIDRYEELGTKLYRTDTMGMIKVKLDKEDIDIIPFIQNDSDLINILNENLLILSFYAIYYLLSYILIKNYLYFETELTINELQ